MKPANGSTQAITSRTWQIFVIATVLIGITFRFANLSGKVYWEDEAYTSIRAAGYTTQQIIDRLYTNTPIPLTDLHQTLQPNQETTPLQVITSLAKDDNHPPSTSCSPTNGAPGSAIPSSP